MRTAVLGRRHPLSTVRITGGTRRPMVRITSNARPPASRSRVTNGRELFVEADGRTAWGRRLRDLIEAHASDLGGVGGLSEAQRSLIRRASTIELRLEQLEGDLAQGKCADLTAYATAAGHLRRILETLGIERKMRTVVPSVDAYLEHINAAKADASP